jgi:hypothetical protein
MVNPALVSPFGAGEVEHPVQPYFSGEERSRQQIEGFEAGFPGLTAELAEGGFGIQRNVDRTEFARRVEPATRAEAGQQGALRYLCVSW